MVERCPEAGETPFTVDNEVGARDSDPDWLRVARVRFEPEDGRASPNSPGGR